VQVVTLAYILVHNVILALAYKAAARLGCRRALPLGLAAILVLYCAVVPGLTAVYQARQVGPGGDDGCCGLLAMGRSCGNEMYPKHHLQLPQHAQ
jgi:hypothetical protein